jgi:hypothetical protein
MPGEFVARIQAAYPLIYWRNNYMNFAIKRLAHAAPVIGVGLLLSISTARAQKTYTVETGRTTVTLADSFISALKSLDVTPGTISPTELKDGRVNFPITGGAIDLETGRGQLLHSGGLTLTAGKTEVKLQSFIIDSTGSEPVITGLVVEDGTLVGRVSLFKIHYPGGITLPLKPNHGVLKRDDLGLSLTATAASALNAAFHVTALSAGVDIGTADVDSILAW